MKPWLRYLGYSIDGLAVVYWFGLYLYLELCEPTANCGLVLDTLYKTRLLLQVATFWMVFRVFHYAFLPKKDGWRLFLTVTFEAQVIVLVLFFGFVTVMTFADGESNWNDVVEWFLFSSWLPAGVLGAFLDCKLNLFSTNVA